MVGGGGEGVVFENGTVDQHCKNVLKLTLA